MDFFPLFAKNTVVQVHPTIRQNRNVSVILPKFYLYLECIASNTAAIYYAAGHAAWTPLTLQCKNTLI